MGASKSVLAAVLAQRGYPIVNDEVAPLCPLEAGPLTIHTVSDCDLLLWQDAMKQLGLDTASYAPLRPGLQRFIVRGTLPLLPTHRPLTLTYALSTFLARHNAPSILQTRLDGQETCTGRF